MEHARHITVLGLALLASLQVACSTRPEPEGAHPSPAALSHTASDAAPAAPPSAAAQASEAAPGAPTEPAAEPAAEPIAAPVAAEPDDQLGLF